MPMKITGKSKVCEVPITASGFWCWRCGQSYTPPKAGNYCCYCPGCKGPT